MKMNEEKILNRIPIETAAVALGLGVLAALLFGVLAGVLLFAGGLLSAVGFLQLRRAIERILGWDRGKAIRAGITTYLLRLALLISAFSIIILFFSRMVLAFAAGFSAIIPVFLVEAVGALIRVKKWKS